MKKLKKFLLSTLSLALVAVLSVAGTLAYLTSEDSDVNVMTMGNVKIAQHEYERATNADGSYKTDTIDNQTSYVLQDFTQDKPLYPIVGDPSKPGNDPEYAGWDATSVRMSQVDSYGGMSVFAGKNAQDKFVTVENTGRSDAYVRTLVAIEIGEGNPALIGTSYHQTWSKNEIGTIEVDGNKYVLIEYLYDGASGVRHENGVLPAKDTTYPSLSQVYLKSETTNEDCEALDGNGNGRLDILVLSQAVQTKGFANAQTALDTAFGDITTTNHPWVDAKTSAPNVENGTMNLTGDIYVVDKPFYNEVDNTSSVTINGNGNTVHSTVTSENVFNWYPGTSGSRPTMGEMFSSTNGSKITINDLTFKGTTHTISLGKYKDSQYGNYDTELNNVNIIGLEVASYGPGYNDKVSGIGQAVIAFGKATFNNTNIYGTKRTGLETGPNWPLYDLAVVNHASATLNNSKVGTIYTWAKSSVIVNNSNVDTIYTAANKTYQGIVVNSGSNVKNIIAHANYSLLINVNAGATVDTIDLTIISNLDNCTINIAEGAKVNKIVTSSKTYTLEEWLNR